MIKSDDFLSPSHPMSVLGFESPRLDSARIERLSDHPEPGNPDLDVALALMDLVRDDLTAFGTGGGEVLSDAEIRLAIRALVRVAKRAGFEFDLPFRNYSGWKTWWIRKGAAGTGGWQARRNLIAGLFDETYAQMVAAQDRALDSSLVEPASEHSELGWPEVDTEVGELRRHFRSARTAQDYRAIGNDCVHVTEALSRKVYVHETMGEESDEREPPADKTKLRLDRYIEHRLPGPENAAMRAYARKTIELAQAVKHDRAATRMEAGISADAVITLANLLRRLAE